MPHLVCFCPDESALTSIVRRVPRRMICPCPCPRQAWTGSGVSDMRCGIASLATHLRDLWQKIDMRGKSSSSSVGEVDVPQTSARASSSRSAVFTNPFR